MNDSVYSHAHDELLITSFRAKITLTGKKSPLLYQAEFSGSKAKYLALGYGENVQTAVADLYRNYRDIRKET